MRKRCFLELCSIFTIKQIKMFVVQICYHHCEHIICPDEIQSIYLPKRNKNCRILVHPLIVQRLIFCDFQPFKQLSAVLADVEEAFQHTHAQRLAKASGTSNNCCFCSCVAEQFSNQSRFVNIIISIFTNFFKVRSSNRNIHFIHLCSSFRAAMHRLSTASMMP